MLPRPVILDRYQVPLPALEPAAVPGGDCHPRPQEARILHNGLQEAGGREETFDRAHGAQGVHT